jgi:hypothetical protein
MMSTIRSNEIRVGMRFGRLAVCGEPYIKVCGSGKSRLFFRCCCDCGTKVEVSGNNLISGNSESCGCLHKDRTREASTVHGDRKRSLYAVWKTMKARCLNPKDRGFVHYGGRGITVCEQWRGSYIAFRDWALSRGYRPGLSIERKDNNGDYEPGNCEWIPRSRQNRNKRSNLRISAFGEMKILVEWAVDSRCVVPRSALYCRLKSGWDAEAALTTPSRRRSGEQATPR